MKNYDCSCYVSYPNKAHKNKNGTWKCIDKYVQREDCEHYNYWEREYKKPSEVISG